jgi:hypothetical protein
MHIRVAIRATAVLHNDLRVRHPTKRSSVQTSTHKQRAQRPRGIPCHQ